MNCPFCARLISAALALLVLIAPAEAQVRTPPTEGTVRVIWGDPPDGPGYIMVVVDTPAGAFELRIDDATLGASGGIVGLMGARVLVEGTTVRGDGGRIGAHIDVTALRVLRRGDALPSLPASTRVDPRGASIVIRPAARTLRYVTVLCRFPDSARVVTTAETTRPSWSASAPSAENYWREVSEDAINFAGSFVVGPYTMPQTRVAYGAEPNLTTLFNDCTGLANNDVDFSQVQGVALQFNATIGCCAWGGGANIALDGPARSVPTVWMPTWTLTTAGTWAHETGHALGLPHSSGPYGQVYDSRWDVMSSTSWRFNAASGIAYGAHTNGFHKLRIGIAPGWRKVSSGGAPERIRLERSAIPADGAAAQVVVIPISNRPGLYYTVEARRKNVSAFYEDSIPSGSDAVVIHLVDEALPEPARVVDVDGNGNPNDAGAAWTVGETFRDVARAIRVRVDSTSATGFWITVENGLVPGVVAREPRFGGDSLAFGVASTRIDSSLVTATAPGGALAAWTAFSGASWIQVASASGFGTAWARWTYQTSGLSPGEYRDSIVVRSLTGGMTRTAIPVVLKIAGAGGPSLAISRGALNDSAAAALWGSFVSINVTVPAGVAWTATRPAAATRIALCTGTCSTGTATVSGTGPGTISWFNNGFSGSIGSVFVDTLTISAAGVGNSPAFFVQTLTVIASPTIATTVRTRRDTMTVGAAPAIDSVRVTLPGAPAGATWSAFDRIFLAGRFLALATRSGTDGQWMRWARRPGTLAPGRYIDTIFVNSPRAQAALVIDTLDIAAAGTPQVTIAPLAKRSTVILGSSVAFDSVVVGILGNATAAWTATASSTRIFLLGNTTPGGSRNGTGAAPVRYVRQTAGLAAGTYVDTISIASAGLTTRPFVDTLVVTSTAPAGPIVVALGPTTISAVAASDSLILPVQLELGASGGSRVGTVQVRVSWDLAKLAFRRTVAGGFGTGTVLTDSTAQGNVRFTFSSPTGTTADVTLATLTLLPAALADGYGNIGASVLALTTETSVSLLSQAATRAHATCIGTAGGRWGDANNDGTVNIIDAQQIARYSIGLSVAVIGAVQLNGDVTADGLANIIDAQQIARHSIGLSAATRTNTARPGAGCL